MPIASFEVGNGGSISKRLHFLRHSGTIFDMNQVQTQNVTQFIWLITKDAFPGRIDLEEASVEIGDAEQINCQVKKPVPPGFDSEAISDLPQLALMASFLGTLELFRVEIYTLYS